MRASFLIMPTIYLCIVVIQSQVLIIHGGILATIVPVKSVVIVTRGRSWTQRRGYIGTSRSDDNTHSSGVIEYASPFVRARLLRVALLLGAVRGVDGAVGGSIDGALWVYVRLLVQFVENQSVRISNVNVLTCGLHFH